MNENRNTEEEIVDIIIVVRDRPSMFRRCLEAVYRHTSQPFRVIVAAGALDAQIEDCLCRLKREKGNLELIFEDRLLDQGEARNLALARSSARLCAVIENDTIVHENWLPPLVDCLREERAAVAAPLIFWYRGVHAAGGSFEEQGEDGRRAFDHRILYDGDRRRSIDYPENHCLLIDRRLLPGRIFDDVEPFDVDLGLTLRQKNLKAFFEPRSKVTYAAPPPIEAADLPHYKLRWDARAWALRSREFNRKWAVEYRSSAKKIASYRRQIYKLGPAAAYPNRATVRLANLGFRAANTLQRFMSRKKAAR